jgi:thiopeptide-type bacteriocin biosynthesis protein
MKDPQNKTSRVDLLYEVYDRVMVRSPCLPLDEFDKLDDAEKHLRSLLDTPYFQLAIHLASPELLYKALQWRDQKVTDAKESEKIFLSILRYWLRMCARSTPFGLFAGCYLANVGTFNKIVLDPMVRRRSVSRLDMNHICDLVDKITRDPAARSQLRFQVNNSLYEIQDRYRYVEYVINNSKRDHFLREVIVDEYLAKVIDHTRTRNGARMSDLVDVLATMNVPSEEAEDFINELIANQILTSELDPNVTGEDSLDQLISTLTVVNPESPFVAGLIEIKNALTRCDTTSQVEQLRALVSSMLPDCEVKNLIQTDLFFDPLEAELDQEMLNVIIGDIGAIIPVGGRADVPRLDVFKQAFKARYEEQEMQLNEVLDKEVGIGYDQDNALDTAPLLDNLLIHGNAKETRHAWSELDAFKLRKFLEAQTTGSKEVVITREEVKELTASTEGASNPLPASAYIHGVLLPGEHQAEAFTFFLRGWNGPSAANLLGRFCSGDSELTDRVRHFLKDEQDHYPGCLLAEIAHLPQGRSGNVINRPILRDYEIPYLAKGSVAPEKQIPIQDLWISIVNDEIVLRSKKLGKRVLPRLSCAHNFVTNTLPVYKFLADLQFDNSLSPFHWNWGALSSQQFLPRVRFGSLILSRAQWSLAKNEKDESFQSFTAKITELRSSFGLPKIVQLVQGDNELLLDLDDKNCLKILFTDLKRNTKVTLVEHLFGKKENAFVRDRLDHRFANELVIPLIKKQPFRNPFVYPQYEKEERVFPFASEWLYVKIYAGTQMAENILKYKIKPFVDEMTACGIIDKWFFIRYWDPSYHIRLRFHGRGDFWKTVMEKLSHLLDEEIRSQQIHNFVVDTYRREIERYGAAPLSLSESVFHYDSEAVCNFLGLLEEDQDEKFRWLFALRGVDYLLNDFNLSPVEKQAFISKLAHAFFKEVNGNKHLKMQLDRSYRERSEEIFSNLNPTNDQANEIQEAVSYFDERSRRLAPIIGKIKGVNDSMSVENFHHLLRSYVHMFLNRILLSNQRKQEMVCYHYLAKYYASVVARKSAERSSAPANNQ